MDMPRSRELINIPQEESLHSLPSSVRVQLELLLTSFWFSRSPTLKYLNNLSMYCHATLDKHSCSPGDTFYRLW